MFNVDLYLPIRHPSSDFIVRGSIKFRYILYKKSDFILFNHPNTNTQKLNKKARIQCAQNGQYAKFKNKQKLQKKVQIG